MTRKKKEPERTTIITSPNRRPYGAKLTLLLEKYTNFHIYGECTLLVKPDIILRIEPKKLRYQEEESWEIYVEGFSTAGEAEQFGLKVALGFLWTAVQGHYSARLLYQTPLPCFVYDRTRSMGPFMSAFGTVSQTKGIADIVDPLDQIISSRKDIDPRLLVALEIFVASRLETTERARFLGIASSIEPIAVQEKYEDENLVSLISEFKTKLNDSDISQNIKDSLQGRIDQLRVESVSKAIKRLINKSLPDNPDALEIIEEAYGLRSKILHEGSTDADLQQKSQKVEEVIRKIFEKYISDYLNNEHK